MLQTLRYFFLKYKAKYGYPISNQERGFLGEQKSTYFLRFQKRYRIIARNWRDTTYGGHGEIDIIAKDAKTLVFIEVKTRPEDALLTGYAAVTPSKKHTLRQTCQAFMRKNPHLAKHYRFDIIEIRFCHKQKFRVLHYINVPLFSHS